MRQPTRWIDWLHYARPKVEWSEAGEILCIDPGETTGWAIFSQGTLQVYGQWDTGRDPSRMAANVRKINAVYGPLGLVLYEEYRVRGNKFKEHVGSEVVTIQHIGAILVVAAELDIPVAKQSAGQAKGFATDVKLRRWGLYQVNQRHANDAIRHGVYHLLFHHDPEKRQHAS